MITPKLNMDEPLDQLPNCSVLHALNMEIDKTSGKLKVENGFNPGNINIPNGTIVGAIPTSSSLIIFVDMGYTGNTKNPDAIYLYDDKTYKLTKTPAKWNYSRGTIRGTYSYNIDNDLIVAVAESDCKDNNDLPIDVPLKIINLNKEEPEELTSIAPIIPITNIREYNINTTGYLIKGFYNLFISYKLSEDNYTKWLSFGSPILINDAKTETISSVSTYDFTSVLIDSFQTNNEYCNKSIDLNIGIKFNTVYKECRIGIVVVRDTDTVGFITNDLNVSNFISTSITNDTIKSYPVENIISDTIYNIYDVKAIENYNNRLYIANYRESNLDVEFPEVNNIKIEYSRLRTGVYSSGKLYQADSTVVTNREIEVVLDTVSGDSRRTSSTTYTVANASELPFKTYCGNFSNIEIIRTEYVVEGRPGSAGFIKEVSVFVSKADNIYVTPGSKDEGRANYGACKYRYGDLNYVITRIKVHNGINRYNEYNTNSFMYKEYDSETGFGIVYKGDTTFTNLHKSKSLIEGEVYNWFIHFIKPDGSSTNGIRIPYVKTTIEYPYGLDNVSGEYIIFNLPSYCTLVSLVSHIQRQSLPVPPKLTHLLNKGYGSNKVYELFNVGYYENSKGEGFARVLNYNSKTIGLYGQIVPLISNVVIPKGYIAYTISYEKPEYLYSSEGLCTFDDIELTSATVPTIDPETPVRFITNELFFDSADFKADLFEYNRHVDITRAAVSNVTLLNGEPRIYYSTGEVSSDDNYEWTSDMILPITNLMVRDADNSNVNNKGRESCVSFKHDVTNGWFKFNGLNYSNNKYYAIGRLLKINKDIYSSDNKKLIPVGFVSWETPYYPNYPNLDGFATIQKLLIYPSSGVLTNEKGIYTGIANNTETVKGLSSFSFNTVSPKLYELKKINNAPKPIIADVVKGDAKKQVTNTPILPKDINDIFKYPVSWLTPTAKYKYNTRPNSINIFNKSIRRSDVVQDESRTLAWRNFRPDGYKIISENKGDITNVVGSGLYLLVHTEHSLFVFNRSSSLQTNDKDVQLYIPDAFEIDYQEVFTSSKGFAGLRDRDSYSISEYGYIFYDRDSNTIYRYDKNALVELSDGIRTLLEHLKIPDSLNDICFGINKNTNTLYISFNNLDTYSCTLSYNLGTESWVSAHSHNAKRYYNTKSKLYGMCDEQLYLYEQSQSDPEYGMYPVIRNSVFVNEYDDDGISPLPYVDIIFNEEYNTLKVLNFIKYKVLYGNGFKNGCKRITIYNYDCYSGVHNTDQPYNPMTMDDVFNGKPYYDNGSWNFSNFRNISAGGWVECDRLTGDIGATTSTDPFGMSNIYGNYFVVRLVFEPINKSLIDVEFNVSKQ